MSNLFTYTHQAIHPASQVDLGGFTVSDVLCALSNTTRNNTTNIENRGLHWTDKRYTENGGCAFLNGVPTGSLLDILQNRKAAKAAVAGRSSKAKLITPVQYQLNLLIRSMRAQILNPVVRTDLWFNAARAERLRKAIVNNNHKRFMAMATDPENINFVVNWMLKG